ncbi:MAG: hypothetical protein R2818_12000 [Flavobacteriales bacterium]
MDLIALDLEHFERIARSFQLVDASGNVVKQWHEEFNSRKRGAWCWMW